MEVNPPKYSNPHLFIDWYEYSPLHDTTEKFGQCYSRYFSIFKNLNSLEEEMLRPDVNTVCKKELNNLRAASKYLGYKDVAGYKKVYAENSFINAVSKNYQDY